MDLAGKYCSLNLSVGENKPMRVYCITVVFVSGFAIVQLHPGYNSQTSSVVCPFSLQADVESILYMHIYSSFMVT